MDIVRKLWDAAGRFVDALLASGGWDLAPATHVAAQVAVLLLGAFLVALLVEILVSPWRALWDRTRYAGLRNEGTRRQIRELRSEGDLEGLGRLLLRHRRFVPAAKVLDEAQRPDLAAEAWQEGGRPRKAAEAWKRADRPLEAAEALEHAGATGEAGSLYLAAGAWARAADAFRRTKDHEASLEAWIRALEDPSLEIGGSERARAAEESLEILASGVELSEDSRRRCLPILARELEHGQRWAEAARLWEQLPAWEDVGRCHDAAGDLVRARDAWRRVGRTDLVAGAEARARESEGDHRGAAEAWSAARDPGAAAAAWERAGEPLRAAECWEEAADCFRAGRAWADGADFERAVRSLQRVPAESPDHEESRLLLGRCFFLLDDWADAAATLENHLLNVRVNRENLEPFYMLARSHERLENPGRALDLFYRIHAVDLEFRDVHDRIERLSESFEAGPSARTSTVGSIPSRLPDSRYRIEGELGRGGMGIVFRAWDTVLERPVALKKLVLPAEAERFRREARAAAGFQHPHLVTVFDYWETTTDAFLAMELVEGPTLAEELRRRGRPLELDDAVQVAIEICRGLAALHRRGIVHRDVKPENVFLTESRGHAKLGDFGLARGPRDRRLTDPGSAMGTPFYLAPEQIEGKPGDERSDLHSLGLVLHECLTGTTFFAGSGDPLVRKLREDPPPPSALCADVGPALDAAVVRALARRPDDRFPDAEAFEAALCALRVRK